MARRRQSKSTRQQSKLNIMHTYAAGIDVGSTFHVVAVPPELSPNPVQAFQSFWL
jgi:transposase